MNLLRSVFFRLAFPLAAPPLCAVLVACGGSGSDGGGGGGGGGASPPPAAALVGTVAIGAALTNGTVEVIDRAGAPACTQTPVTTDTSGRYRCVLGAASEAPFVIVVTDADGLVNPMISVLTTKPAAGSEATANVTPVTTAIVAQLDANKDPFALWGDAAAIAALDPATLEAVKANVVAQLAPVLVDVGVDPAGFDPVTSPFVGGSGTGVDKMLDQVRVTFDNGAPTLSNALNPDAPAVPMADATTTNPPVLAASALSVPFDMAELDVFKREMERCFAVPSATRTINPDFVTRRMDDAAPECWDLLAEIGRTGIDMDFLHNGYDGEAYLFGLLTSADMDGARFNRPELMRYVSQPDGRDEAVLNLKFRTTAGFPDNRVLVAKKFPGSRAGASQWWLIGNQRPLDAFIRAAIRQREQTIPQSVLDASSAFNNAARSRYEVGLEIFVHRPNNGGTVNNPRNPNNAVRYVRVKGPGLPTAGLMYADGNVGMPQNWMSILNATGANPNEAGLPQQFVDHTSNIFRIQRTKGVSGADAYTLRPNPNVGSPTFTTVDWAHPAMYGQAPVATWQFDLSQVPTWSLYTFEAFCGADTTPCHTFTSRIVTPLMPASYAATQQWHAFLPASRAFVSDGAAAASSAEIAWQSNALAERVGTVNAYSHSPSGAVNSASIGVPRGAFSRTVSSVGGEFPPISVSDSTRGRTLQLRHLMLDGSYKDHLIHFN